MSDKFEKFNVSPETRHRPFKMIVPQPLDHWQGIWDSKEAFLEETKGLRYVGMKALIKEEIAAKSKEQTITHIVRSWGFIDGIEDEDLELFPKDGVTPQFRIVSDDFLDGGKYIRRERFMVEYPGSGKEPEVLMDFATYRNPTDGELDFRINSIANSLLPNIIDGKLQLLDNKIDNINSALITKIDNDLQLQQETLSNRITNLELIVKSLQGITDIGDLIEDWFLPSADEAVAIFTNLLSGTDENSVAFDPTDIGGRDMIDEFPSEFYATSTETDTQYYKGVNRETGNIVDVIKTQFSPIRPVRRFISADSYNLREVGQSFNSLIFKSIDNGDGTYTNYEVAHRDLRQAAPWLPKSNVPIGGTSSAFGRGVRNTNAIVSYMKELNITTGSDFQDTCAQLCDRMQMDKEGNIKFI